MHFHNLDRGSAVILPYTKCFVGEPGHWEKHIALDQDGEQEIRDWIDRTQKRTYQSQNARQRKRRACRWAELFSKDNFRIWVRTYRAVEPNWLFNLTEVGISDWEDRETRKCVSCWRIIYPSESEFDEFFPRSKAPHLEWCSFQEGFISKFNQKPDLSADVFLDDIRTLFLSGHGSMCRMRCSSS
jgi:5-methylcytosine-specific restriction endonuclease McrA